MRIDASLRDALGRGVIPESFSERFEAFMMRFGDLFESLPGATRYSERLIPFVLELARTGKPLEERGTGPDVDDRREVFLSHFTGKKRQEAEEQLDLGRASYRLRDNDNMYIGRVKAQLVKALDELGRRNEQGVFAPQPVAWSGDVASVIGEVTRTHSPLTANTEAHGFSTRARQLVGQPAGPGLATGTVRIVMDAADAFRFKAGEVMVCDAVDPTMTFVVPLAAAIVERRGGMLIHGSIIAREYGIPCVTGVPDATSRIRTGDTITVDGYLGHRCLFKEMTRRDRRSRKRP